MWRLVVLSALLGLILANSDHSDGDEKIGKYFSGPSDIRLVANGLRIVNLEEKLKSLKAKLEEAEKIDPERFVHEIDARVSHLEGSHCDDREFQCGGHEQECISDLLVCDGHNDCHNEHDEDDDVCDTSPVKAGNIFSGVSHWSDCLVREDHVTRIVIVGTSRRKFFQSRIWVRAHVESDLEVKGHKEVSEFNAKGYYNFASRRLALVPVDDHDDHYSVLCEFDHGDSERASCHRVTEGTLHECAELFVHLEGHDHDDKH